MNPIFPELPTKLGIYSLTQMLGVREHSELYLAKQSYVDRVVVIEVLRPNSPPELVEFFQETARRRAAASLPHVVPVLESAQTGHLRYLIQELPQGAPLSARTPEDPPLTMEQAFSFVQSVADLYCACQDQGMAANPLTLDSIYMDGGNFSFFSPVIAGERSDEQRAGQMEALANMLEALLPPQETQNSNLSIIIHWLRYGYGNMPLEWHPLSSSLSTLQAQKYTAQKESIDWRELLDPSRLKRRGKRTLRTLRANMVFGIALAVITLLTGVGMAVYLYATRDTDELPSVTDDYIYCGASGRAYRVQTHPVSIEAYGLFLQAWSQMSNAQKKELCEGIPADARNFEPLQWNDQDVAARLGTEWQGRRTTLASPVCGVSYWGALAYARYKKGSLPNAAQIKLVRQYAGEPLLEEWTSSVEAENFPYETSYVVYPAYGGNLSREVDPASRQKQRSFRVSFDYSNNTKS